MSHSGELAALLTALCWSGTATFFSLAGRSVGSVVLNRVRLLLAALFLVVTHWATLSTPFPFDAEPERWIWLALSGVIGLAVGDGLLYQAYIWVGPRLGMLMMSLAPVISATFAWFFLSEVLTGGQVAGLLLTVGGTAWVVLERNRPKGERDVQSDRNYLWGILFGMGAATGQALGLIAAKKGLMGEFPALSGVLIRIVAAAAVIWGFTILRGQTTHTIRRVLGERSAMMNIIGGSFFGPFLGVWLSLVAIQFTEVGVASTLMALPPIFLIPVGYYLFQEQIGPRTVVGTAVAIAGVALLFLL